MIHKSHSKNDLIDIINGLNLPIVFSHADNKRDIQDKFIQYFSSETPEKLKKNYYNVSTKLELQGYLENKNPKKILSVKEKADVMTICKNIIQYCTNGQMIELSKYYKSEQQVKDDMDYIKQFGDVPSVRRCCKVMNKFRKLEDHYLPMISPQIQKAMAEKVERKNVIYGKLVIKRGPIVVTFH
tara:strand:- start:3582 stop:4133 length:552 start_codon:yes stop_codon:yes gene_type:complete